MGRIFCRKPRHRAVLKTWRGCFSQISHFCISGRGFLKKIRWGPESVEKQLILCLSDISSCIIPYQNNLWKHERVKCCCSYVLIVILVCSLLKVYQVGFCFNEVGVPRGNSNLCAIAKKSWKALYYGLNLRFFM